MVAMVWADRVVHAVHPTHLTVQELHKGQGES